MLEAVSAQIASLDGGNILGSVVPVLALVFALLLGAVALLAIGVAGVTAVLLGLLAIPRRFGNGLRALGQRLRPRRRGRVDAGYRRSGFGTLIRRSSATRSCRWWRSGRSSCSWARC